MYNNRCIESINLVENSVHCSTRRNTLQQMVSAPKHGKEGLLVSCSIILVRDLYDSMKIKM